MQNYNEKGLAGLKEIQNAWFEEKGKLENEMVEWSFVLKELRSIRKALCEME